MTKKLVFFIIFWSLTSLVYPKKALAGIYNCDCGPCGSAYCEANCPGGSACVWCEPEPDDCNQGCECCSSCTSGGGCFTGETKIATPGGGPLSPEASEGQGKEIKDIKEGDVVKSFDSETGEIRGSTVTGIHKREASGYWVLKTESGKEVKVTGEHPFLAQQGMGEVSNVSEVPKVSKGQKISQLLNSIWEKVKEVLK